MASRTTLLTSLGAVLLLVACSPVEVPNEGATGADGGDEAGSGDSSDEVRFLIAENFWGDWTPYESTAQSQSRLNRHIYDTLLAFPSGSLDEPEAMLATEWEQVDETTWEFTLREGVTFHDGSDLDGEDVKASVEWASGTTDEDSVLADRWVPTTVEVVDDYTVRLITELPHASIFDAIRQTPIISSDDAAEGTEAMAASPNGTGPFQLTDETTTEKIMGANENYWRDPPAIEELTWEFVADAQTRTNALLAGQADAIDRVPADYHETIESEGGYTLESMTAGEQVNLWSVAGRVTEWDESQELRQAVMIAIDRASLTENLVQGNSIPAQSLMPEDTLYYEEGESAYETDLEQASQMVQDAGMEGLEFEIWVAPGFLPSSEPVAQAIVSNLNEIGLSPTLVTADVAGLTDDRGAGDEGTGLLYHLSWASGGDPAAAMGIYGEGNPWYNGDTQIDEYLEQGVTAGEDAEREQAYSDLQAHMWETLPHIPLYYSDFSVAYTDELQDLRVLPNFDTYFYPASLSEQ